MFCTVQSGKGIPRTSRIRQTPAKPPGGWDLVVTHMGPADKAADGPVFVATPSGARREMTADEKLYYERTRTKARRKYY